MLAKITPDTAPNTSPCGSWRWPGGGMITIVPAGIATNTEWKTKGIWHWVGESKHQLQIEWQDGYVDKLTVSPDGTRLNGVNNDGEKILADRLPLPEGMVRATTK